MGTWLAKGEEKGGHYNVILDSLKVYILLCYEVKHSV